MGRLWVLDEKPDCQHSCAAKGMTDGFDINLCRVHPTDVHKIPVVELGDQIAIRMKWPTHVGETRRVNGNEHG